MMNWLLLLLTAQAFSKGKTCALGFSTGFCPVRLHSR